MVLYTSLSAGLPVKPRTPEEFNRGVKAEPPSGSPSFQQGVGGPPRWQQVYREREREQLPYDPYSYNMYAQDRNKRCKMQNSGYTNSSFYVGSSSSQVATSLLELPPMTRDSSAPVPKYGDSSHYGGSGMTRMAPGPPPLLSTSGPMSPLDEPSPLGLKLKKTPSLLDLISIQLEQGGSGGDQASANPDSSAQDAAKNRPTRYLVPAVVTPPDKMKASNFPASTLKIGTWERTSRYEGDLVGKCYYAKRKLVWEVLENQLKSKIEIQWSDISAMKASCPENLPGTLDIEVSRPPLFFRETNPQPRKHTLWQATSDFTGGQATICKRHSLQFPEGVLNKHYEKLVQCDPRLKALVETAFPTRPPGEFEPTTWLLDAKPQHLPYQPLGGHQNSSLGGKRNPLDVARDLLGLPNLIKMHSDTDSPSSVMDPRGGTDESGNSSCETDEVRLHDDYDIDLTYPSSINMGAHELQDVKPFSNNLFMTRRDDNLKTLAEIRQCLLGEISDQHQLTINAARLGQLSAALAEELPHSFLPNLQQGSDAGHCYSQNTSVVKNEVETDDHNWSGLRAAVTGRLSQRDPSFNTLAQRDPSFNSLMSCFSRNSSAGDLLLNIPRVASLPQLFEAPSQVANGRGLDLPYSTRQPMYFSSIANEKLR